MEDLLTFIFCCLADRERTRIDEADANPDRWYEVITTRSDSSIETLNISDTFKGIIQNFEQYMEKYRFDEINIVICENRKRPEQVYSLFSDALIYSIIHDYFRHSGRLEEMRFVGEIQFQEDGSTPVFKKEYHNYGEEAEIFIDEIAFLYFRNMICYIPDNGDESKPEDGCTYHDFLETAGGNAMIARHLFYEVTWEYPSTLYEQWEAHGTLDELEKMYAEKQQVYTYAGSGDFVRCNYCDKILLVPTGADKCPLCYYEGALAWADESCMETTRAELENSGKYEMIAQHEPEPSEYLSDDVLINEFETSPNFRFRNSENNHWEILDGNRLIRCGSWKEMKSAFKRIIEGEENVEWEGDLKLAEIHCTLKK
jgi:hypothetical protein